MTGMAGQRTASRTLSRKIGLPEGRAAVPFGLATLVNYIGTGIFYPFVLLFFRYQSGASLVAVGACYALATGLGVLAVVRTGALVDRFGPRPVMVGDSLIRATIYFSFQWIHSLALLTILAAIAAIADRTDKVATQAIVYGLAPERARAGWFALSRMTLNAGMGGGALIGGLIILSSSAGYPWLARCDAASFAVTAAITCLFLHPARLPAEAAVRGPQGTCWTDRLFLQVATLSGLLYMIGLSVEIGLPIYLIGYLHKASWTVSLVFGLNTGIIALFQLPVTERIRSRPAMVTLAGATIGYGLAFLLLLPLGLFRGGLLIASLVVAVSLATISELVMAVSSMVVMNDLAVPERRGAYLGVSEFFAGAGVTAAPLLFTAVLALSPVVLWIGLAVVSVGVAAGALALGGPVMARTTRHGAGS